MPNFSEISYAKDLIRTNGSKIYITFGTSVYGADYDPSINNVTYVALPPKVIYGYVVAVSAEKLVWKNYGLKEMGAIEILCDYKYKDWFKNCISVSTNGKNYRVFKLAQGKLALIQDRAAGIVKVTLEILN